MSSAVIVVGGGGVRVATGSPQPVNVSVPTDQPVEVTAPIGLPGQEGPVGPVGPPGPPGTGTGGSSDTFIQSTPAAVWVITHDLGYNAGITVVDSAGEQCEGEVKYGPMGTITVTFSAAFSGTAYLS